MPFSTPLALAIYFTIWWTVLFAVLPLGVHSMHEDGEVPKGFEPGAPVAPRLLMKAGLTTVVATAVFAAVVVIVKILE